MNQIYLEDQAFYRDIINILIKNKFPFLVGGGIAAKFYSPIARPMKDLDIFVKAGDYPKIINILKKEGFKVIIKDPRWLAQIKSRKQQIDFIFSSPNYMNPVDESWFTHARSSKILGHKIWVIAPEELIWAKSYIQQRVHFDGNDVAHIILTQGKNLDWKRLLMRMENHWELLLIILIHFGFVYPSERYLIPKRLFEELLSRFQNQLNNPLPKGKICRGPLLSIDEYQLDITEGGFQFIV